LDIILDTEGILPPVPQDETLFDADAFRDELSSPPRRAFGVDTDVLTPPERRPAAATSGEAEPASGESAGAEHASRSGRRKPSGSGAVDEERRGSPRRAHKKDAGRAHVRPAKPRTAPAERPAKPAEPSRHPEAGHAAARHARAGRIRSRAALVVRRILSVFLIIVVMVVTLYGLALAVNVFARWNARRVAALSAAPASAAQDNLLVIGVSDGVAIGFTALKAEHSSGRVLGIAIPDGAFLEVPGQGFERVGDSYAGGPVVSTDAVTNFLGVPFRKYVVVNGDTYQVMLKTQDVSGLMRSITSTDLTSQQRASFTQYFASVNTKNVWIVPLPVKAVAVGDQNYFEPQRPQIADLLLQWWGVQSSQQQSMPRVIVYNGVGTPGIAGVAAQQLIRAGLKVVDSGNADNFNHATTLILLYHGTQADAQDVRTALGVGQIVVQSAPELVTDMIVIIGADYKPPASDISTVPTQGVQ
jgi:hypothetical protein